MSTRDPSVDLARVLCLLAVVAIHTGMVGLGDAGGGSGGLAVTNPLTELSFFTVGTWLAQVMPLFFLLGGFGAYHSMRRLENGGAEGGSAGPACFGDYLRTRTVRLGRPAAVFYAVIAVAGLALLLAGVPQEMVRPALLGAGDPIWFLAAFLICQGFVRVQYRLVVHGGASRFWAVVAGTTVAVAGVDAVRYLVLENRVFEDVDGDAVGLVNLWLLWPLLQLLGIALAHGRLARARWWAWVLIGVFGFTATALLGTVGYYGPDMLINLNPPVLPLLSIGIMYLAVFELARPVLRAVAGTRPVQAVMFLVGSRAVHLYLWHMTVVILVNGLLWLAGWVPQPGGTVWWWTRIPLYLVVLAVTLGAAWATGRPENAHPSSPLPTWAAWVALYLAVAPNLLVTRLGLDVTLAVTGALLLGAAVLLAGARWKRPIPPRARRAGARRRTRSRPAPDGPGRSSPGATAGSRRAGDVES